MYHRLVSIIIEAGNITSSLFIPPFSCNNMGIPRQILITVALKKPLVHTSLIRYLLVGHSARELFIPLVLSAMLIIVTLVMEGGEKRIPMQRISIHNIYADKNYLAIKLNPVGIMPVMFALF